MANSRLAIMVQVRVWLALGGYVEFEWKTCKATIVKPGGERAAIDGRTYSGFLKTLAPRLVRTETGHQDSKDLIIFWRAK